MIPSKLGRNESCWCGSGKKYKKCHLGRAQQKPIDHWEVSKELQENFSLEICSSPIGLHSECSKKIIKAHTIPKSASLKAIAVNGHVYGFIFSLDSIRRHQGRVKPELIGVNRASTFSGFCKIHDDKIFAPLEKDTFNSTQEQCFLLAYRAFCRECYTKSAMVNLHELRSNLDRGKSLDKQMDIQLQSFLTNIGAQAGIRDNDFHKERLDKALEDRKFNGCQAIVFEFEDPPPVMVSGVVNPDFDFNGNRIQDLGDLEKIPNLLAMNSFFDGQKGYIVMSWQDYASEAPIKLVESLLLKPPSDHEKYLVQYIFKNFENCFIAPYWWDACTKLDRETLTDLMADTVSLLSDPNGNGIASLQVNVEFPIIRGTKFINWTSEVDL